MFLLSLLPADALVKHRPIAAHTSGAPGKQPASLKQRAAIINAGLDALKENIHPNKITRDVVAEYRARLEELAEPGLTEDQLIARVSSFGFDDLFSPVATDTAPPVIANYSRWAMRRVRNAAFDNV
jgi:hypothetical protein